MPNIIQVTHIYLTYISYVGRWEGSGGFPNPPKTNLEPACTNGHLMLAELQTWTFITSEFWMWKEALKCNQPVGHFVLKCIPTFLATTVFTLQGGNVEWRSSALLWRWAFEFIPICKKGAVVKVSFNQTWLWNEIHVALQRLHEPLVTIS